MFEQLKDYVRTKPHLYDFLKLIRRRIFPKPDPTYDFFDSFSKSHSGKVNFVQIGANDGLRNDPIREFVIRDRWKGIFVEPLLTVFGMLQNNYAYASNSGLVFVNAAISASDSNSFIFYTFDNCFLQSLSLEKRLDYLRKASFDRKHVEHHISKMSEGAIKEIEVTCLTMTSFLNKYWTGGKIDLLVIDAEGHEPSIIKSIDFDKFQPEAIYFESHNLGEGKGTLFGVLNDNGYSVSEIGGDAIALKPK